MLGVGVGLSAAASVTIAKLLHAEEYGVYIMAVTLLNYGVIVARAGTDSSTVRYVNEYFAQGRLDLAGEFVSWAKGTVWKTSLILASLGLIAGGLAAGMVPTVDSRPVIVAALGLCPLAFVFLYSSLLRAEKKIVRSQLPLSVLRPTFALTSALLLAWVGLESGSAVALGELAGLALLVLPLHSLTKHMNEKNFPGSVDSLYDEWRSTSKGITLSAVTQQLMGQADIITVGVFFGMTSAGVYGLASRLAKLVALGNRAADAIAAPLVAESYHAGDRDALQAIVSQACSLVTAATIVMSIGLFLVPEFVFLWLGESFKTLRMVLLVLVAGQVVNAVSGPVGVVLLMTGHERDQIVVNGVFGTALVAGIAVVSDLGGSIEDVAILFALAIGLSNVAKVVYVYHRTGVKCIPALSFNDTAQRTGSVTRESGE